MPLTVGEKPETDSPAGRVRSDREHKPVRSPGRLGIERHIDLGAPGEPSAVGRVGVARPHRDARARSLDLRPGGDGGCVRAPRRTQAANLLRPHVVVEGEALAADAHVGHG
jgi:hypothetical protein